MNLLFWIVPLRDILQISIETSYGGDVPYIYPYLIAYIYVAQVVISK